MIVCLKYRQPRTTLKCHATVSNTCPVTATVTPPVDLSRFIEENLFKAFCSTLVNQCPLHGLSKVTQLYKCSVLSMWYRCVRCVLTFWGLKILELSLFWKRQVRVTKGCRTCKEYIGISSKLHNVAMKIMVSMSRTNWNKKCFSPVTALAGLPDVCPTANRKMPNLEAEFQVNNMVLYLQY